MATATRPSPPQAAFQPYVPATESPAEFTAKAIVLGVLFGLLFGASTVYLGLRAGLTVSASIPIAVLAISVLKRSWRRHDPRKQHRPDHRVGGRIGGGRRGVHDSGAHLPGAVRTRVFQLLSNHDADLRGRHPRRPDDGAAAPRVDREGTRHASVSRGHGMRRGARRGRAGRQAGRARVQRPWRGSPLEGAVVGLQPVPHRGWLYGAASKPVPERDAERRHLARISRRRLRHRSGDRGHDVRGRRAVVARAAAAPVDPRTIHHATTAAHPSRLRGEPGNRPAVPDFRDGPRPDLERVYPLHRRRRRARGRIDHACPHDSDHRQLGHRRPEEPGRDRDRGSRSGPSAKYRWASC